MNFVAVSLINDKPQSSVQTKTAAPAACRMALVSFRLGAQSKPKPHKQLQLPEISLLEVAEHDSASDCWLVIYDRIYDVTRFLDTHPGGDDVMLEYAGRDASMAFRGCAHSEHAIGLLASHLIGELPAGERIFRCAGKLLISDLPM